MPRPGLVYDIDKSSKPILMLRGDEVVSQQLGAGSRVIYPPEPLLTVINPRMSVGDAFAKPMGTDSLEAQLRADMKLTIAFDIRSLGGLPLQSPDPRQRVIEAVLNMAAKAGVDDVEIVVARGLNRRLYDSELRRTLGDRVFDSFAPRELLGQHNADDHEALVTLGTTKQNETVEINRRVAESDLVVFVSVNDEPRAGGWNSIVAGLSSAQTVGHLYNPEISHAESLAVAERIGHVIASKVKIFQVEVALNNRVFPGVGTAMQRREAELSIPQRLTAGVIGSATSIIPSRVKRQGAKYLTSTQGIIGVFAGDVAEAHAAATTRLAQQQVTNVEGQTDILSVAVPFIAPYGANSILNPVLVASAALGVYNDHSGSPVVADGGVIIVHHPTKEEFHPVHHPSYIDFFEQVLTETNDASVIKTRFEDRFAKDSWYSNLYQTSYAFHALHPLHRWYECARTASNLGAVIVVGGQTSTVRRLGLKSASTMTDAMELAADIVGKTKPTLTHLHNPPTVVTAVR